MILWPALPQFSIWNPRAINRFVNSLQDALALVVRSSSFLSSFSNSGMCNSESNPFCNDNINALIHLDNTIANYRTH